MRKGEKSSDISYNRISHLAGTTGATQENPFWRFFEAQGRQSSSERLLRDQFSSTAASCLYFSLPINYISLTSLHKRFSALLFGSPICFDVLHQSAKGIFPSVSFGRFWRYIRKTSMLQIFWIFRIF